MAGPEAAHAPLPTRRPGRSRGSSIAGRLDGGNARRQGGVRLLDL